MSHSASCSSASSTSALQAGTGSSGRLVTVHLRAAQVVIGSADKHGPDRLDAACRRAIGIGNPTYRTVRGILAAHLESTPQEPTVGRASAHGVINPPPLARPPRIR